VVAVVGAALVLLAVPFVHARFERPDARSLPRSSPSRQLYEAAVARFGGQNTSSITVVADAAPDDAHFGAWLTDLRHRPGVREVSTHAVAHGVTAVDLVPAGSRQGPRAEALVRELRAHRPAFHIAVAGDAAELVDFEAAIGGRLPLALAIVGGATLLLIFLMTGSIVVAVKALVMNVLSLGATFGALVWIFQDGHMSGLLGFDSIGALDVISPVLIFLFAFGLSMDYEVFLLSRIREVYEETGDNDVAVATGLQRTGRIITSAALLMVVVFAGFASGELLVIKQLGIGLAAAVLVDATIVRTLLVPATMKLMGRWNWWAPRPLRRLRGRAPALAT
jgi:RND superfamily putative drug exporter